MQLIDEVIEKIEDLRFCRGGELLAQALASACSSQYGISMLDVSVSLDEGNQQLVFRLGRITQESDYDNDDQYNALIWLKQNNLLPKKQG